MCKIDRFNDEINASTKDISVSDLQVISKDMTQVLKDGEELKQKTYTALCCADRRLTDDDTAVISQLKNVTLKQKTPIRVLHRRNLAERERTAGTYIKEFIHGDFGRTVPSLGSCLNADVDILELDVEEIHLDWPPPRK
ncbi:hypothetical protein MRX96_024186 [Rhipicephalus microplus]